MALDANERGTIRVGVPTSTEVAAPVATLTLGREVARKILHLSVAALPVTWGLGRISDETVRFVVTLGFAIAIVVEGARHLAPGVRARFGAWFGVLLRPHEHEELTGATWLAAAFFGVVVVLPPVAALVAMWAVAVGDGVATIVGRTAAASHGDALVRIGGGKTLVGSLACAGATAAGVLWLTDLGILRAIAIAAAAALAEWPRAPLDDNVRVAAIAGLAAWGVGAA